MVVVVVGKVHRLVMMKQKCLFDNRCGLMALGRRIDGHDYEFLSTKML
jgi:hypothetical protein